MSTSCCATIMQHEEGLLHARDEQVHQRSGRPARVSTQHVCVHERERPATASQRREQRMTPRAPNFLTFTYLDSPVYSRRRPLEAPPPVLAAPRTRAALQAHTLRRQSTINRYVEAQGARQGRGGGRGRPE